MIDSGPSLSVSNDGYFPNRTFNFEEFSQSVLPTLEAGIALKISNDLEGNPNAFLNNTQTQTDYSYSPSFLSWLDILLRKLVASLMNELAEFQKELQNAVLDCISAQLHLSHCHDSIDSVQSMSTGVQTIAHFDEDWEDSDCCRVQRPRSTGSLICSV
jgi:hypothetical protein